MGRLPGIRDEFNEANSIDSGVIFALYEGTSGAPAQQIDTLPYANQLLSRGWVTTTDLPVLADGTRTLASITPMTQSTHPELCSLTPELVIINCYYGHGSIHDAHEDILLHAAAAE